MPRTTYPDAPTISLFFQRLVEALERDRDVDAVAVASSAPFAPGVRAGAVVANRAASVSKQRVVEHVVGAGYFRALDIPILAGRSFDERDRSTSPPVVIVSEATARQLWPDRHPIGQQLERDGRPHEVVGVVGDVRGGEGSGPRGGGFDGLPSPAMYLSALQFPQRTMTVLMRTGLAPSALVPRLRAALRANDPAIPMPEPRTLEAWLADTVANPRLTTTLATAFAMIAALLAGIGIYGLVAHSVGQRTPEIALRMAVGATKGDVLALVLRRGLMSAAIGTTLGLLGALWVSQVLGTLLFDIRPDDPLTFAAVATLLVGVSVIACYVPARRAARIDPLVALRAE